MIKIIDKHTAKLVVEVGKGKSRHRKTRLVEYSGKRDLERKYREFEDEVTHNPLTDTTVEELVVAHIRNRRQLGVEETTIDGYEVAARRIYSALGWLKAKDLTSYQVQEFVTNLSEKYAPKTVRNTVSLLSSAYNNAMRLGQLETNPCQLVSLPKKSKPEYDIFTSDEIARFLAALRETRLDYKVAYELALFCGMRRSEICGLRECHVNIPFKYITIKQARCKTKRGEVVKGTKTETSHRHIAVPDFVLEDIIELIEMHNSVQYEHTDYLIQNGFGDPIGHSALTSQIYRINKKAGLTNASLHDLRHTFASMLNHANVDIAMISRELGHCNITTTLNIYTHVFDNVADSSRSIADLLNSRFEKPFEMGTSTALSDHKKAAEA